jgi:hypothetical protein
MMSLKRLVLSIVTLLAVLGLSATAQAKRYSLTGGGAQLQIGGGLPLPIQVKPLTGGGMEAYGGTVFPPLLIPVRNGFPHVDQTTAMTVDQKIVVPRGSLRKFPAQTILGQFDNNPNLYAVATNLEYSWPNAPAVFSAAARTGATTTTIVVGPGRSIKYSHPTTPLGGKFGGPATFRLAGGVGAGLMPNSPVTIYAIPPPLRPIGNPPCTHTALTTGMGGPFPPGGNVIPFCVAALGQALPTGIAGPGGGQVAAPNFVTTPGGTPVVVGQGGPKPGVGIVKAGTGFIHPAGPKGTISAFVFTPGSMTGFTNMASSFGFPWTRNKINLAATLASGGAETWTLTGKDTRTAGGKGTLQLVSGSLSTRTATGDNANRGWVRLEIGDFDLSGVPALSPSLLLTAGGLLLLSFGYAARRLSS